MSETHPILIATAFGLEAVVQHELRALGLEGKGLSTGRILVHGTLADVCRLNINLRSAERVLIGVGRFEAPDFDALFERTQELPWERWIAREFAFPVDGRSHKSRLSSVPAVQRTVKKAIVNRLMRAHKTGSLPENGPPVRIEVSMLEDVATITIDSSGDGLHKRGYRTWYGQAALRETMAAALVQLSTWRDGRVLWDPFCGSGTIAIEAALIGLGIAPGLNRRFDGERWSLLNGAFWKAAREEAQAKIRPRLAEPIIASDIDPEQIELAIRAAKLAGVGNHIRFDVADFQQIPTRAEYGVVITNPPYGIRLGEEQELDLLYGQMPEVFSKLPTWSFHLLTGRLDLERQFGQEASRRRKLFNAEIECTYFTFLGPKPPRPEDRLAGAAHEAAVEVDPAVAPDPTEGDEGAFGEVRDAAPEGEYDEVPSTVLVVPDDAGATSPSGREHRPEVEDEEQEVHSKMIGDEPEKLAVLIEDGAEAHDGEHPPSPLDADDQPMPAPGSLADRSPAGQPPLPPMKAFAAFGGLRERDEREIAEFGRCLANNLRHLRKYPKRGVTGFRVYERDYPEVPLIIDRYQDAETGPEETVGVYFHAVEYERMHSRTLAQQMQWYRKIRATIAEVSGVPESNIFLKPKPRQRGTTQFVKLSDEQLTAVQEEDGLRFRINLTDYIDTGLFLDHRMTRQMAGREAEGKRVLNLFCYTGSFTVYAAAHGASSTASVDLSHTYLDWLEENLKLNNLWPGPHDLIRSDVLAFLREHPKPRTSDERQAGFYDLAIVDPPTFSNSKSTHDDWVVAESHVELFTHLAPLLSPGGVVYFSTNYRRFKLAQEHLESLGLSIREISGKTVPPEYRNRRIHRCWRMVKAVGAGRARGDLGDPAPTEQG